MLLHFYVFYMISVTISLCSCFKKLAIIKYASKTFWQGGKTNSNHHVPIEPKDLSELEKTLSDGVIKVFTVRKYGPTIKYLL